MAERADWLSFDDARQLLEKHLAGSQKVLHCEVVAYIMLGIAAELKEDKELWEIVALCHDLDEEQTKYERTKHGLLTADLLEGRLPIEALNAIRAHDHRTGFVANSTLALGLRLSDALAIADQFAGRALISGLADGTGQERLRSALNSRP